MWSWGLYYTQRAAGFFLLGLYHESLTNYFTMNFALMQHHKYSLTDIENMMPWEREIYSSLLADYVQKENERVEQMNQSSP